MRVSSINTKNYIPFKSGKVNVYSDFDQTYYPFLKQGDIGKNPASSRPDLVSYFNNFRKFFNNTKENLDFHITTGRTFGEFETIAYQLKEAGYKMPLPKTLIVKNGSDEHIKLASDEEFYSGKKFPFSYSQINKQKESEIKNATNWNASEIRENLIKELKNYNFKIFECDTENSVKDYGYKSLYSKISDKNQWVADIRKDGNLKIHLSLPSNCDFAKDKKNYNFFSDIKNSAIKFLEKDQKDASKVKYSQKEFEDSRGRQVLEFSPNMEALFEGLHNEDNALSKLYDTRKAVQEARNNNDLVIVAGDGSNDYEMLNPAMYIDFPKSFNINSNYAKPADADFIKKLEAATDDNLKDMNITQTDRQNLLKQLLSVPIVGIIVKKDEKLSKEFETLINTYGETSKYKKIVQIKEGHLQDGISNAIKQYANSNEEYAKALKKDIKDEIDYSFDGAKKVVKRTKKAVNETNEFSKSKLILPIIIGCGIIFSALTKIFAKPKDQKDNLNTYLNK